MLFHEIGMPVGDAVLGSAVLNASGILGSYLSSRLIDRSRHTLRIMIVSYVLAALAVGSIGTFGGSRVLIMASTSLVGLFLIGTQMSLTAYIADFYPSAVRASGIGLTQAMGRGGSLLGPLVGGALLSRGVLPLSGVQARHDSGPSGRRGVAGIATTQSHPPDQCPPCLDRQRRSRSTTCAPRRGAGCRISCSNRWKRARVSARAARVNHDRLKRWLLLPRALVDLAEASRAQTVFGRPYASPFGPFGGRICGQFQARRGPSVRRGGKSSRHTVHPVGGQQSPHRTHRPGGSRSRVVSTLRCQRPCTHR